MKVKPLQALVLIVLFVVILSGILIATNSDNKWPFVTPTATFTATQTSTSTQTSTATSPPDLGYEAVTMEQAACFDWSNQSLADIDAFELVRVLGTNRDGDWYRVRWPKVRFDCWVESRLLNPSNFNHEELYVISEPFPPVFTPTPTSTLTFTPSPTFFTSLVASTATEKPTKTPKTRGPSPTSTSSPTQTPTPSATSTATPTLTPTITRTPTNTFTPTATRTPTKTSTPTTPPCNRPAAPSNLAVTRHGQSPNIDLTWDSVSGAAEYEVFRSVNGGQFSSLGRTNRPNMDDSTRDDGTYRYYVIAINTCGESNRSNVLEISR